MATAPMLADEYEPEAEAVEDPGMSNDELVAALQREFEAADSYHDELSKARELNRRYYEGKAFGNEITGRSQIVLPDVQEAVDYMVPSVLRTFVSGDNVVEFEAVDEESEPGAEEATQAIGFNFMRQQPGYRILHDMTTDGLIERTGVVKSTMETLEKITRQQVTITDPVQLEGAPGEIEDAVEQPDGSHLVTIKSTKRERRFIDVPVPPEQFRFSPLARDEDSADYLAQVEPRTRSDLVDMGFDRDQVYSLPAYNREYESTRSTDSSFREADSTPALEKVLFKEEYARIDRDGDGIAERIKVFRVENEILIDAETGELSIETVEDQPFTVFSPYPRPHRLVGYSLAEKVMDLQLSRSTVARQLFDGMYNANMPRPIIDTSVATDAHTIDDLLSPIPGGPIRAKGGAASVQPYATTFDVGKSLQVLEWITGERESRTGITRLNQGLDADALNKTATGTAMMQAAGEQQQEFVARNLAEALARLFGKKYRLMRSEGEPFSIKVDGQYKQVDPSQWPEEINIRPRVGLGSGSKDKRIQYRMQLTPLMAEGMQAGQVSPKNAFRMMDGLARDMQLGTGADFWIDPDAPPEIDPQTGQPKPPAPEKPDPAMVEVQMKQQAQQQQQAHDQSIAQATLALKSQESDLKLQNMREQAQQQASLAERKATFEASLAERKFQAETDLAARRQDFEMALAQSKHEHDVSIANAKLSQDRPGGALDA